MEIVTTVTHARVGILGNPSDGFFGKTIAAAIHNFSAQVVLYEWPVIEILPGPSDLVRYSTMDNLAEDVRTVGYYGGSRLIKAAIKRFHDWTQERGIELPKRNFSIRYESNIPRQVGLAGSSAIITSTIKALMRFYQVTVPPPQLAGLVLSVETMELGIYGGLQDRVAQAYDCVVYMDFDRKLIEDRGYGEYEVLDASLLPPMYLAFKSSLTHRDTLHNDVRARWEKGDQQVHNAMRLLGENARNGKNALLAGDAAEFNRLLDLNFDLRASIYPIAPTNMDMIRLARSMGFSAAFPGSGGAVLGICPDRRRIPELVDAFAALDCTVVECLFSEQ